MTITTRI